MFKYIGKLRKGHQGRPNKKSVDSDGLSNDETKKATHKDRDFINAADIFNTLPPEKPFDGERVSRR